MNKSLLLVAFFAILAVSVSAQSFSTSGFTYNGWRANTLHFLKNNLGANPTTYNGHSCTSPRKGSCPTDSSDLWAGGALYAKNNGNNPAMNKLADYISQNLDALGIQYVIWKQRIFGNWNRKWVGMENRGSITQNHFDHVHITFRDQAPSGTPKPVNGGGSNPSPNPPPPSSGVPVQKRRLVKGLSGADVKYWQDKLRGAGFFSAQSTGYYGDITFASTKKFQASRKLEQVGEVGPLTWAAMHKVVRSATPQVQEYEHQSPANRFRHHRSVRVNVNVEA